MVVATTRNELDITQPEQVSRWLDRHAPQVVFNAAAQARVDAAELDPQQAFRVNGEGPGVLARACASRGILLVHLSTDYVFGGDLYRRTPYREGDPREPCGAYGRSKAAGEDAVQEAGGEFLVVRTQWVFGEGGWNLPDAMLERARAGEELRLTGDQEGTPTCAIELAEGLLTLWRQGARGLFHLSGRGSCTPFQWISTCFAAAGISFRATEVSSSSLGRPATRPRYSVLNGSRAAERGIVLSHWKEATLRHLEKRSDPSPSE